MNTQAPVAGHLKNIKRTALYIGAGMILAGILGTAGYYGWHKFHKNSGPTAITGVPKPTTPQATTAQEAKRYGQVIDQSLQSGDTTAYQNAQLSLVYGYLLQNDYASAGQLLATIKQKVPIEDLSITFYMDSYQVDQHAGDKTAEKADLQSLIPLLQAQGRKSEADGYQKILAAL